MNKYTFEAKNIEEATEKALTSLNTSKDNLIINVIEEKNTLLKKLAIIEVIKYNDVIDFIKENISEILKLMGIEVKFEVRRREDNLIIKLFSNNNAILIGKNGATIQALQVLIRDRKSVV